VDNPGIGINDFVMLEDNPLSQDTIDIDVAILQGRGVTVYYYELCVALTPTDAGVADPLTLTFYVDGVEADLARLDIWGVGLWSFENTAAVIPSLTADMLDADGWSIEWPRGEGLQTRTNFEGIGTFADAIAAGGFGDAGGVSYSGSCIPPLVVKGAPVSGMLVDVLLLLACTFGGVAALRRRKSG